MTERGAIAGPSSTGPATAYAKSLLVEAIRRPADSGTSEVRRSAIAPSPADLGRSSTLTLPAETLMSSRPVGTREPSLPSASTLTRAVVSPGLSTSNCLLLVLASIPGRSCERDGAVVAGIASVPPKTAVDVSRAAIDMAPRREWTWTASSGSPAASVSSLMVLDWNASRTIPWESTASTGPFLPQSETSATAGASETFVRVKVVKCLEPEPAPRYHASWRTPGHDATDNPPPVFRDGVSAVKPTAPDPFGSLPATRSAVPLTVASAQPEDFARAAICSRPGSASAEVLAPG